MGPAVFGFLAGAMTLPNLYIVCNVLLIFLCFWFHNGKANKWNRKKVSIMPYEGFNQLAINSWCLKKDSLVREMKDVISPTLKW